MVLGRGKPQCKSLCSLTDRPNFMDAEYKMSKSGSIYSNWTDGPFCLSILSRTFWEWNHCQMALPVNSCFRWVELREINSQYWKEASRTGQSRAERRAAGESCSIGQVGAGFHNQMKTESSSKPFVMLHDELVEKSALSPSMLPSPVSLLLLIHGSGIGGKSWKTKQKI